MSPDYEMHQNCDFQSHENETPSQNSEIIS